MNKTNLRKLAKTLENAETAKHFDMGTFFRSRERALWYKPISEAITHCGTAACIGGWGAILAKGNEPYDSMNTEAIAQEWLGLDDNTAEQLFYPSHAEGRDEFWDKYRTTVYNATAKQATKVVRNLIKTGNVDWSVA